MLLYTYMIRFLEGTIAQVHDSAVVVAVHGVGYLVYTNTNRYQFVLGDQITLHTHQAVRETALDLYGFPSERALHYFELLLTVPKIGPKSALQVLALADPDLIATAVLLNDGEHLHTISGVGKKTASNIVVALAGKIEETALTNIDLVAAASDLTPAQQDAIDALITLGYDPKDASYNVRKLDPTLETKHLIQAVLKKISTP